MSLAKYNRSHLKKVFSPDIGVEASAQILDIPVYACGLSLCRALISTKNPNFEMASSCSAGTRRLENPARVAGGALETAPSGARLRWLPDQPMPCPVAWCLDFNPRLITGRP
jgi:hypothetical protein